MFFFQFFCWPLAKKKKKNLLTKTPFNKFRCYFKIFVWYCFKICFADYFKISTYTYICIYTFISNIKINHCGDMFVRLVINCCYARLDALFIICRIQFNIYHVLYSYSIYKSKKRYIVFFFFNFVITVVVVAFLNWNSNTQILNTLYSCNKKKKTKKN